MARLGRVRLMSRTITSFLRNLKRHFGVEYASEQLRSIIERYTNETSSGYFGNIKPSEAQKRLIEICEDMHILVDRYLENSLIGSMNSYKLMKRVFGEQCLLSEGKVSIKASKEVSSDSIQNPSDIDSGYDGHKGQGYQVQLSETYSVGRTETTESASQEIRLDLITYVSVESADKSDSRALLPALEELELREVKPVEFLVDSLYGGDDNVNKSQVMNVEILSPVMGKKSSKDYMGFEFDVESKHVTVCPNGKSPISVIHNKKEIITARWRTEDCQGCPLKDNCQTKIGLSGRRLHYTKKELRLWQRRQKETGSEFKDKYRYRAGIEATISRFIHMTGARRVRYRGMKRVGFAETMKALGINIFRITKYVLN
jgi:hypothetical protein